MSADSTTSKHEFQAEVKQVLDIVINSLYSHREIFLRELISNAADAMDKLRFQAVTDHSLMDGDETLEIKILPDPDNKCLTIVDNGIGMTKDELVQHLGTIAHSGSKSFVDALKQKGDGDEVDLIGRFGVGFYSAFLVADEVEVVSRAAGQDEAWSWRSKADGTFEITEAKRSERGTEIHLYLGDDHQEFLDEWRLKTLVKRYSDYIGHPIKLAVTRSEGEGDDATEKTELEVVNEGQALWRRPKSEIKDEQYEEFYKHLTHDFEPPVARNHFKIEGTQEFIGLLFLPKNPPFDMWDRDHRRGVRLYVKRVFIMDDCEEILPTWLRFVRGIVDSDDLPLNVSREMLQEDRTVRNIRKNVIKKALDAIESLAKSDVGAYVEFWGHYGAVLKEGLHDDPAAKDQLSRLVRYISTKEELTSLEDYVKRMPEGQESIYYAMGPTRNTVEGSPHLESLAKKGYEVLLMIDPVDEWAVRGLGEFDGKKLVSAMQTDLELGEESEADKTKSEAATKDLGGLLTKIKETLSDQVAEVRISKRLTESPTCLVVPDGGAHAHIERMIRAQGGDAPQTKRVFELNPDHQVIKGLSRLLGQKGEEAAVKEWIYTLYDQALLAEGSPVADPASFARRMSKLMSQALPKEAGAES
ncbi:MAG: molecular chaperone HtpG [Planctomycetota bacterium]